MTAVVVVGPPGCGKTRNSEYLRRAFRKKRIVDGWDGRSRLGRDDIALTNQFPVVPHGTYRVLSYEGAMGAAAIENPADISNNRVEFDWLPWWPPRTPSDPDAEHAADYAELRRVLDLALRAASQGKGRERHADGNPFPEQPMIAIARMVGVGFPLGQAMKKCQEAARFAARRHLAPSSLAKAEILDAIVYLAGAHIALERVGGIETSRGVEPPAASANPPDEKSAVRIKFAVDTKMLRKMVADVRRSVTRRGRLRNGRSRNKKRGRGK